MKAAKRFLNMLLTLCMLLSLLPSTVFAANSNVPFTDVKETDWFYDAVGYVYENGMMSGTGNNQFSPNVTTTRGMIVTILYRLEGSPAVSTSSFDDVAAGEYYANGVSWAAANGVVSGYGNNLFGPNDPITREQMATILHRYAQHKEYETTVSGDVSSFTDGASVSSYAVEPMNWAVGIGLLSGVGNNMINPTGNATRAQVATILMRFCKNCVEQPSEEVTYTVTFNYNYGTDGTYKTVTVPEGKTVDKPANPSRSGYSFGGWYVETTGGRQFDFDTVITEDITLYAHWSRNSSGGDINGGSDGEIPTPDPTPDNPVVPDEIAELFGVDPDDTDTDGDGLSNYLEIYKTGTDPLLIDSNNDGLNDGDEDADGDGLTNIQEIELGTDISKRDTDADGLSDYEEVFTYHTDPCEFDTDNDGLGDGDEIYLGLNPLVAKTDGATLDSEREFTQELSDDNFSSELLSADNDAIPSLILTASGNINNIVRVISTDSNDFSDSRAIVGTAIDIQGDNIDNGILSFALNDDGTSILRILGTNDEFNTNLICKYNEDGSTEYLETTYNALSNTVSANISVEGTYFVLNVKNLFDELGLVLPSVTDIGLLEDPSISTMSNMDDYPDTSDNNNHAPARSSTYTVSADTYVADADTQKITLASSTSGGALAQADIVFIIDTTGSMGDEIDNVKDNLNLFVDILKAKGVSAAFALIDYEDITVDGIDSTRVHKNGTSNWFYDVDTYKSIISSLSLGDGGDTDECVVDALETARLLDMRASAGKFFVLVTDAGYKVDNRYGIPSMAAEIELLKNAGVSCSVVSSSGEQSTYYNLYTETNGIWSNIYGDFSEELSALADRIGDEIVGDGYWIYLQGPVPVPVRLDKDPAIDPTADTDGDGILDVDELEGTTPTGEIDLDELISMISKGAITGTDYGIVKMYKYKSNPTEIDTDFDGTDDKFDNMPKSNSFEGVMHYELDERDRTCVIDFNMDYRNLIDGSNTQYSRDLSELSILYASDVYDDVYIQLNKGITGGDDNPTTFGKLLGLEDTKCYELKSSSYTEDKDDITEFFVGHKNIRYNGTDYEVIIVSVRGTNGTNAEWSSNFDVGADTTEYYNATGYSHPDWKTKANHKGFDVSANRVLDVLSDYINTYVDLSAQKSILITGHSRGAAIANIIGAHFEDDPGYRSYTYTFATPNSTTASNAGSYQTIFNIKNSDDIIPYLPIAEWGFTNYGITKAISVEDNYENKWFGAQEGTWEWFIGVDYNNDGGTSRTLNSFAKIANSREDLYKLDNGSDGKVWENNLGHTTYSGAQKELEELKATLESEKLLKFCNVYIVGGGILYHVEINYSPAYLMQTLCNMTTGTGPKLGHDVKGKYASAKASFVASSGKIPGMAIIGGMTHPHMQPTYYIIAHNGFRKVD